MLHVSAALRKPNQVHAGAKGELMKEQNLVSYATSGESFRADINNLGKPFICLGRDLFLIE